MFSDSYAPIIFASEEDDEDLTVGKIFGGKLILQHWKNFRQTEKEDKFPAEEEKSPLINNRYSSFVEESQRKIKSQIQKAHSLF